MKRKNTFLLLLKIILINQIIFMPGRGLGQDYLRPSAAANSHSIPVGRLGPKSSSAGNNLTNTNEILTGMRTDHGDGTSPEKTALGRAAIASSHDPGDIVRSVRLEDIPAEIDSFERLIEGIKQSVERVYAENPDIRSPALGQLRIFRKKVKEYLEAHKRDKTEGLIRDSISQLRVLLSREKAVAGSFGDTAKITAFTFIEMEIEKRSVKPLVRLLNPGKPTETEARLIKQMAEEEWKRFMAVRDKMVSMYAELGEENNAREEELNEKKEGIEKRIAKLRGEQEKYAGRKQEKAIITKIKKEQEKVEKIKKDIANTKEAAFMFRAYQGFVGEITKYKLDGAKSPVLEKVDALIQQNRSASDIIYGVIYADLEEKRSRHAEGTRMYQTLSEYLRLIKEFIGHLHGVDPFYLKAPAEKDELILFTDEEIGVPALSKLISEHKIKGIASRDGTVTAHWVVVASQKKIPVVILKGLKEERGSVEKIVNPGDEIVLETRKEEGQSAVVTRPDQPTKNRHRLAMREHELYHRLCLDSIPSIRSKEQPLLIYGNVAEPEEVLDILNEKGYGIGLVRTEIYLNWLDPILKAYIQAHSTANEALKEAHREELLAECSNAMSEYFKIFREQKGPLTIRTFDITRDKNKDILEAMPDGQQEEGFRFYATEIGKEILMVQIASIIDALYVASGEEEGYSFKPRIIFPAVKTAEEMQWIFKQVLPAAIKMAKEKIKAEIKTKNARKRMDRKDAERFNVTVRNLKYGLMIETAEVVENIEEVVSNPRVAVLSVGTNDLISRILSKAYGFGVLRGDEHDEHYFFELSPEVLRAIEAAAKAIRGWNEANPNNKKILGVCGELASREKFLLFALYLKKKYDIPVYLSMPSESMPILEYFASFVEPEDLSIFEEIDEGTEAEAVEKLEEIYERIRSSRAYQQNVKEVVDTERQFFAVPAEPVTRPDITAAIITAISQSA